MVWDIVKEVGQNQSIPFPNIRVLCNKGAYINAKTDDDDIHMTISFKVEARQIDTFSFGTQL